MIGISESDVENSALNGLKTQAETSSATRMPDNTDNAVCGEQ